MSHAPAEKPSFSLYDVLLADLRKRSGHEVWVDSELAGDQLWWVEFGYAIELGKPVLPVKITTMADWAMPNHLAQVQVLDYSTRRDPGDAGVECAFALSAAVSNLARDGDALPDPVPDQHPVPDSYLSDPCIESMIPRCST